MGLLVNGKWQDKWYDTKKTKGEFVREQSKFLNKIENKENSKYPAENNRYHLYVSLACPWAHRTLIYRELKDLTKIISVSVVHPHMLNQGWSFEKYDDFASGDDLYNKKYLHEIYTLCENNYTGRVTVPVLWDKSEKKIVSNESADIIRMFNTEFNQLTNNNDDYYPKNLIAQIDEINNIIYESINNGVYRCGFATSQEAYDKAIDILFENLEALEIRLSKQNYLVGNEVTEADIRLFTTLVRFDPVYFGHFKCNIRQITDYPNLKKYLISLYNYKNIKSTVNIEHIKQHYYYSHAQINPTRIVPKGPIHAIPF